MKQSNLAEYSFGKKNRKQNFFSFVHRNLNSALFFTQSCQHTPLDVWNTKIENLSNLVFQPFDTLHTARCVKHKNEAFIKYYGSGFWHFTNAPSLFLCFDLLSYFPRLLASFQPVSCGTCMRPQQTKCPCLSPPRQNKQKGLHNYWVGTKWQFSYQLLYKYLKAIAMTYLPFIMKGNKWK